MRAAHASMGQAGSNGGMPGIGAPGLMGGLPGILSTETPAPTGAGGIMQDRQGQFRGAGD